MLPFAAGSAPAAKGVITEMSPAHLRQDALGAITLVESAATLTTQGLFGLIYSSLSAIDRGNLTFFCNGASPTSRSNLRILFEANGSYFF